jgi:predicted anti-sigma-YlaC factor YlaD
MKLQIDCRETSRWLSRLQDESLPAADRARLRLHLVMCENCRNVEDQLRFIRQAMQRMAAGDGEAAPPAD